MRLNYVVVPEEYEDAIDGVLDDAEIAHQDIRYHGLDLIKGNPLIPDYDTALRELDLWHKANLWSNAPVVIPTASTSTSELVDMLPVGSELWTELVEICAEEQANEEGRDRDEVIEEMKMPVSEDFKAVMNQLRDTWRLDRV